MRKIEYKEYGLIRRNEKVCTYTKKNKIYKKTKIKYIYTIMACF